MRIKDPTAGFKLYKRKVLETIDLNHVEFVGYAFQIEMKFRAWKKGFKIVELPIIFKDREKGVSKIKQQYYKGGCVRSVKNENKKHVFVFV